MPSIATRDFGLIEYHPNAELYFPQGLPGFENQKRFVLIQKEALAPLIFLQSAEAAALCFITVPVHLIELGYQLGMTEEDQRTLAIRDGELLLLAILSAPQNSPPDSMMTANLLAPVVINLKTRTGVQAVRPDMRYSHQHPLPEAVGSRL